MQCRTVLLIGSDDLLWCSVRTACQSTREIHVVDDVVEPRHAIDQVRACNPDAILLELSDAALDPSVLALLPEVHAACPATRIVVFASSLRPDEFLTLVSLGVHGFIYWCDLDLPTVRHCLDAVLSAELTVASRSVPTELLSAQPLHTGPRARISLSDREQAILNALAEGLTQKEIAASTQLSVRTVKRTVANLEEKLEAPSPFVLGARARALGLLSTTG